MHSQTQYRAVLSPCIGVCTMGDDGLCHGCHRTGAEIARWSQMNDDERLTLMEAVLPAREASAHVNLPPFPDEVLKAALHPLATAPAGRGWNHDELADLLPLDAALVDAAVLVPLVQRDALNVVLTRRIDELRHHAGQVSFPGGRVDATDADPVAAALREAQEEIGLAPAQAQLLGFLDPLATLTGFRVLPVVARIAPDFVAVPEPGEVAEVFEVPLAWLLAPDNLQRIDIDYRGRTRQVLQYRRHEDAVEQNIWGATASILYNLRERIAESATGGRA